MKALDERLEWQRVAQWTTVLLADIQEMKDWRAPEVPFDDIRERYIAARDAFATDPTPVSAMAVLAVGSWMAEKVTRLSLLARPSIEFQNLCAEVIAAFESVQKRAEGQAARATGSPR